jgi:hypothetical protein
MPKEDNSINRSKPRKEFSRSKKEKSKSKSSSNKMINSLWNPDQIWFYQKNSLRNSLTPLRTSELT